VFEWVDLLEAVLGAEGRLARTGRVNFAIGDPAAWYGQAIVDEGSSPSQVDTVAAVTLPELLRPFDRVDLIHCDIQGAEADVFEQAAPEVDAKVRRVHVGTHGSDVEARLRRLFGSRGWTNLNDYGEARLRRPRGAR
jgi:FkbM family methyltransferase